MTKNNNDNKREPLTPVANVGDIITVEGYGIRMFRVDALTFERYIDAENDVDDIYYDCTCVKTHEPMLAGQEDVTVIGKAEDGAVHIGRILERTPVAVEPTGEPTNIDDLLDELSDALALVELLGDSETEGDRKYALRVCEIKAKLLDLSVTNAKGK